MATHAGLLRTRDEDETRVTPIELFFDLVYVLAVTQLTHHVLANLSLRGAGETLLLLLAVWTAWMRETSSACSSGCWPAARCGSRALAEGDARAGALAGRLDSPVRRRLERFTRLWPWPRAAISC